MRGVKKMDFTLRVFGTIIAALVLGCSVWGGIAAYNAYRQQAKLQAYQAVHAARLRACEEASASAAKLFSPRTDDDFYSAWLSFAEVKHGKALMLLDPNIVNLMIEINNRGAVVMNANGYCSFANRTICILGDKPFELALACREMVNRDYSKEAGTKLPEFDSEGTPPEKRIAMRWAQSLCPDVCRAKLAKMPKE